MSDDGAGAGSLDGGGVDSVDVDVVGVDVVVGPPFEPLELLAPSDMHQPPLSPIQWYPLGQDPLLVPPPLVFPPEVPVVVVSDIQ